MHVAIYDAAGAIVMLMDADEATIALNVPEGGRFEDVTDELLARLAERKPDPEPTP